MEIFFWGGPERPFKWILIKNKTIIISFSCFTNYLRKCSFNRMCKCLNVCSSSNVDWNIIKYYRFVKAEKAGTRKWNAETASSKFISDETIF